MKQYTKLQLAIIQSGKDHEEMMERNGFYDEEDNFAQLD